MFEGIDSIFIWAQIAGLMAMCFSIAAWQMKKQEHILMCYVPGGFFWSIQYFLLGAYNASLFSFVCIFKDTALARSSERYLKYIVAAFILFNIVLVVLFYKTTHDLLPLLICLLVNLPLLKKDNRYWMARCNLMAQLCWIIFNFNAGAWMGVICANIIIFSIIIGMIRVEEWEIGRCYRSFLPSITRALFAYSKPQTYP